MVVLRIYSRLIEVVLSIVNSVHSVHYNVHSDTFCIHEMTIYTKSTNTTYPIFRDNLRTTGEHWARGVTWNSENRRADEEKTTESGDEQQHWPEREGSRQDEAENGEERRQPPARSRGSEQQIRKRREEAVRGRRGTTIAAEEWEKASRMGGEWGKSPSCENLTLPIAGVRNDGI